jgi:predicted nucleic acid-binding protein
VILYVDSSALLKLYVEEEHSLHARSMLVDPRDWTTARHTQVEVRRNLTRILEASGFTTFRHWFDHDWTELSVIELSEPVCAKSADFAEETGVRTLDALHLGAAWAAGADRGLPIVTFDRRLAAAARGLGWDVLGAE